jgi:hypothetical protein
MKRFLLIVQLCFEVATFAAAQAAKQTTDVLGAHLNYGRGCAACHSPHSGTLDDGTAKTANASSGLATLWGEDTSRLYGKTIAADDTKFVEVFPASMSANTPDVAGMLSCLGCHDGNYAPRAMMNNRVYERLPSGYGSANSIATLMGSDRGAFGNYLDDHPMGLNARIRCGGSGWDCVETNGVVRMSGVKSAQFVANYGFFIKPESYGNSAVIVCTTCHDPHSMNVVAIGGKSSSGLPPGTYATMFFLRAPYNPNDPNPQSNQTAQFCRQCHADKSNEMNGSNARTVF